MLCLILMKHWIDGIDQKNHTYDYGIYKANIKPLTKEEIELYKTSKKYNL